MGELSCLNQGPGAPHPPSVCGRRQAGHGGSLRGGGGGGAAAELPVIRELTAGGLISYQGNQQARPSPPL